MSKSDGENFRDKRRLDDQGNCTEHLPYDDREEKMNKDEIIAEYLNTIKVQKVDLKFHATPSKLKGKKKTVPMEFLAGLDTAEP